MASRLNAYYVIKKVDIQDQFALITYDIIYATHAWSRTTRIDMDKVGKFTTEDLRKRVRLEAMQLISRRAPVENNIRRMEKMIGDERAF